MSELRAMDADLERALERVNVPSYAIDPTGIIRWVNPAAKRLVGDVRGRQFTSVVAPHEKRRAREVFAKKIVGGVEMTDTEAVLIGAGGEPVSVEISAVALHRGDRVIGVFGQIADEHDHEPVRAHPALTPRQTEVLKLLDRGRSTNQIAAELHLSKETVRNHIRHLMRTLGVHSRLEAVAIARHEHLVGVK
jgi:PAS domain S-box-containing protein